MGESRGLPRPEAPDIFELTPPPPLQARVGNGVVRLPVVQPKGERQRTEAVKRMTKGALQIGQLLYPEKVEWRPRTRADCAHVPRPCPYVGCRYHLYLDVTGIGSLTVNYDCEPWELRDSCALDLAEQGGRKLEEIGELLGGISRERVRQLEDIIFARVADEAALDLGMLPDPGEGAPAVVGLTWNIGSAQSAGSDECSPGRRAVQCVSREAATACIRMIAAIALPL